MVLDAGLGIAWRTPPLMDALARDKKVSDGAVRFVLLEKIGRAKSGQIVSPEVLDVALTTVGL